MKKIIAYIKRQIEIIRYSPSRDFREIMGKVLGEREEES